MMSMNDRARFLIVSWMTTPIRRTGTVLVAGVLLLLIGATAVRLAEATGSANTGSLAAGSQADRAAVTASCQQKTVIFDLSAQR
jgi:hypothetical protein